MKTLVPEDLPPRSTRTVQSLVRACAAFVRARASNNYPADTCRELYEHDRDALTIVKGAVSPASLTGWGGPARTAVADLVASLGPVSAASALIARSLQLSFGDAAAISVPSFEASAADIAFIAEGEPYPVRVQSVVPQLLHPRKLGVIVGLTNEMVEHSNLEAILRETLARSVGLRLDVAMFDDAPASASRPAGLREGIAPLVASAETDPHEAMISDIQAVIASVAAVSGAGEVILVASPASAAAIALRARRELAYTVLPTGGLADDALIAIAPAGLVSAFGAPSIEASHQSASHYESVTPLQLGTAGVPSVVAAPVRSTWQTDSIELKLRMVAAWALRDPRALSWLVPAGW